MHIGAVEALKLRATQHLIDKYLKQGARGPDRHALVLRPRDRARTSGTRSPRARARVDGGYEVLKKASWTTSAGFADFYVCQTTSPDYNGDYSNLSVFVVTTTRSRPSRRSGTRWACAATSRARCCCDWEFVPETSCRPDRRRRDLERRVGRPELPDRLLGLLERHLAGRDRHRLPHTTRKTHKDVGMRVCDYPTIQDAVGEAIMDTNAIRLLPRRRPGRCDWSATTAQKYAAARASWPAATTCTGCGRSSSTPPRTWPSRRQDAALLRRHRLTRRSRCSSSATCATARPAGSWARPTRCCGSSSARPPCWAWSRSTTGTRCQPAGPGERAEEAHARAEEGAGGAPHVRGLRLGAAVRRPWGPAALGGGAPIAADPAVPQGSSEESPAGATVGAAGRPSHPPHRWCRRARARAHCSALLAARCYAAELAVGLRACRAVPPWRRSSVG